MPSSSESLPVMRRNFRYIPSSKSLLSTPFPPGIPPHLLRQKNKKRPSPEEEGLADLDVLSFLSFTSGLRERANLTNQQQKIVQNVSKQNFWCFCSDSKKRSLKKVATQTNLKQVLRFVFFIQVLEFCRLTWFFSFIPQELVDSRQIAFQRIHGKPIFPYIKKNRYQKRQTKTHKETSNLTNDLHTYLNDPYFGGFDPQKGRSTPQNRGQLSSRYVNVFTSINWFLWCFQNQRFSDSGC